MCHTPPPCQDRVKEGYRWEPWELQDSWELHTKSVLELSVFFRFLCLGFTLMQRKKDSGMVRNIMMREASNNKSEQQPGPLLSATIGYFQVSTKQYRYKMSVCRTPKLLNSSFHCTTTHIINHTNDFQYLLF